MNHEVAITYKDCKSFDRGNNNNIISNEQQDVNERDINAIFIKLVRHGYESMNEGDLITIETLAKQCPLVAGTASFKARSLWAMYEPTMQYDDIKLCNTVGLNKSSVGNSNNFLSNESSYLQQLNSQKTRIAIESNRVFKIYPNPASLKAIANYSLNKNETGILAIYDLQGRKMKEFKLENNSNSTSIDLESLHQGMYTYKFLINNSHSYVGKLLVE